MREIPLTRGKVAIVDNEDFEVLSQWKWYAAVNGKRCYAARTNWTGAPPKQVRMACQIMAHPISMEVDHINGNPLDNRRSNLRVCTHRENGANRNRQQGGTSTYKGVSWHKETKRWRAQIQYAGTVFHLGCHSDESEAAFRYDLAARGLFREFARPNFPIESKEKI